MLFPPTLSTEGLVIVQSLSLSPSALDLTSLAVVVLTSLWLSLTTYVVGSTSLGSDPVRRRLETRQVTINMSVNQPCLAGQGDMHKPLQHHWQSAVHKKPDFDMNRTY